VFLITPGEIEEIAGLINVPQHAQEVLALIPPLAAERCRDSLDQISTERLGVVSHHLFAPKSTHGVFLPLDGVDEKSIINAFRDVQKQKKEDASDESEESEGVVKELQVL
jgi:hypothetical protein